MKSMANLSSSPDQGSVIFLPLEVCRRELVGKVFLATYLAKQGHTVILFQSDFFDRYGWPASGIYIGKNCFRTEVPYKTEHYEKMKNVGVSVWYLDEEGGVYAGQDSRDWTKRLKLRLDAKTLGPKDKILCWGKWQAEVFKEQAPEAEVLVTGSPNFDVFDPKYKEFFLDYDLKQTEGEEDYVLVNTRFSLTNGFIKLTDHLTGCGPSSKLLDSYQFAEIALTVGTLQYMMSKLVLKLARVFPNKRFIVRPHPAEDPSFYIAVFRGMDNVAVRWSGCVGSWIRRSSVLIHNGCTTALQAHLALKPVITYIPIEEPKDSEMKLPNSIGLICRSEDDVIASLISVPTLTEANRGIGDTVDGQRSIERIADLVHCSGLRACSRSHRGNILRIVLRHHIRNRIKQIVRETGAKFIKNLRERIEKEEKQFDRDFYATTIGLHAIANRAFSADTRIKEYPGSCYAIFPTDKVG